MWHAHAPPPEAKRFARHCGMSPLDFSSTITVSVHNRNTPNTNNSRLLPLHRHTGDNIEKLLATIANGLAQRHARVHLAPPDPIKLRRWIALEMGIIASRRVAASYYRTATQPQDVQAVVDQIHAPNFHVPRLLLLDDEEKPAKGGQEEEEEEENKLVPRRHTPAAQTVAAHTPASDSDMTGFESSQSKKRRKARFSYTRLPLTEEAGAQTGADAEDTRREMDRLCRQLEQLVPRKEVAFENRHAGARKKAVQVADGRVAETQETYDWARTHCESMPRGAPASIRTNAEETERIAERYLHVAQQKLEEIKNAPSFQAQVHGEGRRPELGLSMEGRKEDVDGNNNNDYDKGNDTAMLRELNSLYTMLNVMRLGPGRLFTLLEMNPGFASQLKLQVLASREQNEGKEEPGNRG